MSYDGNSRGPLTAEQIKALIVEVFPHVDPGDHWQLANIIQLAARMAISQHRPGLLTDEQIASLIDLDTLSETGDHADLHAAYQAAAAMGARLVFELAIRQVSVLHGPACYVCKLCDSARAATPESISHRDRCADLHARIKAP